MALTLLPRNSHLLFKKKKNQKEKQHKQQQQTNPDPPPPPHTHTPDVDPTKQRSIITEEVALVEFMYLVLTSMPGGMTVYGSCLPFCVHVTSFESELTPFVC